MSPWLILAALVTAGAMTSGAYWQGRKDGAAGEIATQAREDAIAQRATDAAVTAAAQAISSIKVQHRTITQEVEREIRETPVYVDCRHSPDQLQRINAALTGATDPKPAGGGVVPRAGAPD